MKNLTVNVYVQLVNEADTDGKSLYLLSSDFPIETIPGLMEYLQEYLTEAIENGDIPEHLEIKIVP